MKRLFALSLVLMMGLSFVACENVKEDVYEAETEVEVEETEAEMEVEENEAETEAEAEVEEVEIVEEAEEEEPETEIKYVALELSGEGVTNQMARKACFFYCKI